MAKELLNDDSVILQKPEDFLELQTRELVMSNVSSLPLTTGLKLQKPFQILLDDNSEVSETVSTLVKRNTLFIWQIIRTVEFSYKKKKY